MCADPLTGMTGPAMHKPLVIICGLDHANIAEEQDVFAKAGIRHQVVVARTDAEYLERCREADGLLVHPLQTREVMAELTLPALAKGLAAAGPRAPITMSESATVSARRPARATWSSA